MPYGSVSEVPSYVPKSKRKQWMEVWNSAYKEHGDEATAFAEANGVVHRHKKAFFIKATSGELYPDPGTEINEEEEAEVRDELDLWADYAEDGPTFDPTGNYLCKSCTMRSGTDKCTHVVSPISFDTGSCRLYTKGPKSNEAPLPQKLTQIESAYTERPHVKGFGCKRCMFGSPAKKADDQGRKYWCAFWGCHVEANACCFKNTGSDDVLAPVKGKKDKSEKVGKAAMEQPTTLRKTETEVAIFCPLVKVDEVKREVWGIVTAEKPDRDDEICDYDSTAPYYKAYADEMAKTSDGKNIFPLRAMHSMIAAGKGIAIHFDDAKKHVFMGFKVVDDNEWKKVAEGVYTGFSQGGKYIKKWKDGEFVRYTAKPIEVSLVDVPCLPSATFEYVKATGEVELRKFQKAAPLPTEAGVIPTTPTPVTDVPIACICACANCLMGNCNECTDKCPNCGKVGKSVKYLVTVNGETHLPYTKEDGKPNHRLMGAAWAALHEGYRGNKYEGPGKAGAIKRLKRLYAQEGLDTPSEKAAHIDGVLKEALANALGCKAYGLLGKGLYQIGNFARIVEDVKYLYFALEQEREYEGDESPVTDELAETFEALLGHLLDYTTEQIEEEKARHLV